MVMFRSSYRVNLFCCVAVDPVPGMTLRYVFTRRRRAGQCIQVKPWPPRTFFVSHSHTFRLRTASPSSHIINSWRTRSRFPSNTVARCAAPYQTQRGTHVEKKCRLHVCIGSGCSLTIPQGLLLLCPSYADKDSFDSQLNVLEMGTS